MASFFHVEIYCSQYCFKLGSINITGPSFLKNYLRIFTECTISLHFCTCVLQPTIQLVCNNSLLILSRLTGHFCEIPLLKSQLVACFLGCLTKLCKSWRFRIVLDYLFFYLFLRKPIIYIYAAEYMCYLVWPKAQVPKLTLAVSGGDGTRVHFPVCPRVSLQGWSHDVFPQVYQSRQSSTSVDCKVYLSQYVLKWKVPSGLYSSAELPFS